MNVSLPKDLIEFVREETRGGGYGDNSDVVRDALRLLRQRRQETGALKRLLSEGLEELAQDKDPPLTREELRTIAETAKRPRPARRGGRA